ncbi:hypothetical protein [Cryptosporangium japonicum]|uniref:Transposase n=1 Tax=Cryptosporangium japonicum TaxID=80872 RepID=A0ABP3F1A6_9ACTN
MQPESWVEQLAAERATRVERKAAERAFHAVRRRHGVRARNRAKVERLEEEPSYLPEGGS